MPKCAKCGGKMLFPNVYLKNGYLCKSCYNTYFNLITDPGGHTLEELEERKAKIEKNRRPEAEIRRTSLSTPTLTCGIASFYDEDRVLQIKRPTYLQEIKYQDILEYHGAQNIREKEKMQSLTSFFLNDLAWGEEANMLTALFKNGPIRSTCDGVALKLTVATEEKPVYIHFLKIAGVSTESAIYQSAINEIEICMRKVHAICEENNKKNSPSPDSSSAPSSAPLSPADEIRKYKTLLDDGIITQEEFDAKKAKLLDL